MSLLTIVQNALARTNLPTVSSVINNSDKNAALFLSLAQQEGKELARRSAWRALIREQTFTTVAQAAQTGALPADMDWVIPETMFDRTLSRRVHGPMSPEEWQLKEASLVTQVDPAFRIRGTSLLIAPTPAAGNTVGFEYVSKNWCQSSGGTGQAAWAADSDTGLLDEELITLGVIWRFKMSHGFDFSDDLQVYERQVQQAQMREGVRPRISTDPASRRLGGEVIAGTRPNAIMTEAGDFILWD